MATLAELAPSPPHSPSLTMRRKSWARRCERYCCNVVSYFPLCIVYGLTTWAVWVSYKIGVEERQSTGRDYFFAWLAMILYCMLNWSYTTAVFTDPGSPVDQSNGGYNSLPTQELSRPYTSFTVKSNGGLRYCKKCQTKKPDRAHHCSTCKRCVLKMDHHCPWLATCVGLRNYKAFMLFLIYLSLFCWACFALSGAWCWKEFTSDSYMDSLTPVNYIVLAVISGIVGLVITGFTAWHIMLAARGLTTIESLEKTRYLSPLRKSMQQHFNSQGQRHYVDSADGRPSIGEQLVEIHANALPGVMRPEEGEDYRSESPAQRSLQRNWADMEAQRERERYDEYLDELDSEKLPNAFDLGWRRNLMHVMGENPWLWGIPVCNTTGDGWQWEASPKWVAARERIAEERFTQMQRQKDRERAAGWGIDSPPLPPSSPPRYTSTYYTSRPAAPPSPPLQRPSNRNSRFLTTSNGIATVPREGRRSPGKADAILGRAPGLYSDDPGMPGVPMQYMPSRRNGNRASYDDLDDFDDEDEGDEEREYDESSDEGEAAAKERRNGGDGSDAPGPSRSQQHSASSSTAAVPEIKTENWNDLPAEMVGRSSRDRAKTSRGPAVAKKIRKSRADEEWQEWGTR
ncbi:Zinc finger DHHC-type palmitoyltransferase protein [Macrophomina phaseolina MS6]|uniref:Palmitoyltransferase n=1 Tax=Macrophomina phaseolina (strain MS6) TaxID=1126212 RepID=K2S0K5_MACPH|nr:Zinc finger DHHC-type palmitoyltransferase protein [Macrophomina phaseolina MS6]